MNQNLITLDVRPDFRAGQSPCDKIQGALASVTAEKPLRLLVPFEPVPIYAVAHGKGLTHEAKAVGNGEWEVLFSRPAASGIDSDATRPAQACSCRGH